MGDHFVLLADRLLTESTLEAVIQSKRQLQNIPITDDEDVMIDLTSYAMDINVESSAMKIVQCRICHDEDVDSNMEVPCTCCGSLKYAHRRCVQRWCNEKGDTKCEICQQQFKPGYTATPSLYHYGSMPMTFRGNWEISRRDLHNSQLIPLVPADRNFLDPHVPAENTVPSSKILTYFHVVALIFMILLVSRHSLPAVINGSDRYPFAFFTLLSLRIVGILLPIYLILRAITTICRRYLLQNAGSSLLTTLGEEDDFQLRPRRPA